MEVTFEEHFKRPDLADADIVILHRTEAVGEPQGDAARNEDQHLEQQEQQQQQQQQQQCRELARFHVHQLFLLKSDFFKAQVQRWMNNHCSDTHFLTQSDTAAAAAAAAAAGAHHSSRPTLELTVDSADHLPAAEAVIAAMYGMTAPIQRLSQVQLLAAALIADRIQVAAAVKQAVAALAAAAAEDSGLTAAALEHLARLPAWPTCLLPLLPAAVAGTRCCSGSSSELTDIQAADTAARVRRMLLAVLGNLEAVWADEQLKQILLALPLPAMQLLLSSDSLIVANEDTMLFTATQYMLSKADDWATRAAVQAALAPLVRCPQLSRFALMWAALSEDSTQLLLSGYEQQLRQLLSLRCVADACASSSSSSSSSSMDCSCSGDAGTAHTTSATALAAAAAAAAAAADIDDAPASWSSPARQIQPLEAGAHVLWRLPLEKLIQACRDSVAKQQGMTLEGPESPPVGGLAWRMRFVCEPKSAEKSLIGAYADIVAPDGIFYAAHITLSCRQGGVQHELRTPLLRSVIGYGDDDFFGIGAMGGGGWDGEVWAARGLPAAGDLELEMVVHSVC